MKIAIGVGLRGRTPKGVGSRLQRSEKRDLQTPLETTLDGIALLACGEGGEQGLINRFAQEMDAAVAETEVAAARVVAGETASVEHELGCSARQSVRTVDAVEGVVGIVGDPEPPAMAPLVSASHFTHQQRVAGSIRDMGNPGVGVVKQDAIGTR